MQKCTLIVPCKDASNKYISYGRYMYLFKPFIEKGIFDLREIDANTYNISDIETDVVLMFKCPEYHSPNLMKDIYKLPSNKKLITYVADIHWEGFLTGKDTDTDKIYLENVDRIFNRSNLILCPYKSMFLRLWPQYKDKFIFFPHFSVFVVDTLSKQSNYPYKCLLSGKIDEWYPDRQYIKELNHPDITVLPHPGYSAYDNKIDNQYAVGLDYTHQLSKSFCSIATAGIMNYTTGKYFEIPGAGSILLGTYTEDLDDLGFKNCDNFIHISKRNFVDVLKEIIDKQKYLFDVRLAGYLHIYRNHTVGIRVNQLRKILENV